MRVLEKILRAGTYAPSALALQPWAFVVVQDQKFLNRVSDYCKPIMISLMKDAHDGMSDGFRATAGEPGIFDLLPCPDRHHGHREDRQPVPGDRLLALR